MRSMVLYLHMHQPWRAQKYSIFDVGQDHNYFDDADWGSGTNNRRIFEKVTPSPLKKTLLLTLYNNKTLS